MAATIKSRAKGLLTATSSLLGDKKLPAKLRQSLEGLRGELRKTWKDLESEADEDETEEVEESSHREIQSALQTAIQDSNDGMEAWILDVFEDVAIHNLYTADENYSHMGLFAAPYSIGEDGKASIGTPYPVKPKTTYEPVGDVQESGGFETSSEFVSLVESSVRKDGTIEVKLIQPGWGSSGYYGADLLERDGPKVFKAGTQMFWNHQTPIEEQQRPEGSLANLSAVLVSDARYVKDHAQGPGLYADSKVFSDYREAIDEMAPHIGVSIRAAGKARRGTAEGQEGLIIEEINLGKSADFVTVPGAGGQIVELFESVGRKPRTQPIKQEEIEVNEAQARELKESNVKLSGALAQLQAAFIASEAKQLARATLDTHKYRLMVIPDAVKSKVVAQAAAGVALDEAGSIDSVKLEESLAALIQSEMAYLREALGSDFQAAGFGSSNTLLLESGNDEEVDYDALLSESFERVGVSKAAAQAAAKGRG